MSKQTVSYSAGRLVGAVIDASGLSDFVRGVQDAVQPENDLTKALVGSLIAALPFVLPLFTKETEAPSKQEPAVETPEAPADADGCGGCCRRST